MARGNIILSASFRSKDFWRCFPLLLMNLHNLCLPALGLDSTDMATLSNLAFDSGLPANVDAEKTILGAILLDNAAHAEAAEKIDFEDFSLDSHRRIYMR